MNDKRDLLKDKATCEAMTMGPWEACYSHAGYSDIVNMHTRESIAWKVKPSDAQSMALARIAWPHAVDRAIAAEAENARLRELIRDTLCSGKYCYRVTEQKTCPDKCPAKELLRDGPDLPTTYRLTDEDANAWECSACGEVWQLTTGSPQENNMRYCPYCGRRIEEGGKPHA